MRPRGEQRGDGRRGTALSRRSCPLSAATGGPDAAEDAGEGGPARHRRQEGSTHACEAPDKREGLRGTCQVHCEHVSETDERKMTLKLNFLNFEQQQCMQGVRQNEFGLW